MKRKRELIAVILLPVLYLYIMKLHSGFFLGLAAFSAVIALMEFYQMYSVKRALRLLGIISGLALLFLVYIEYREIHLPVTLFFLTAVIIRLLDSQKGIKNALNDLAPVITGFIYIPFMLCLLIAVREAGPEWIIFTAGTVWASDSFAYYFGKRFGRRKLYSTVSPNKTVEGAAASVAGGIVAGTVIKLFLIEGITIASSMAIGAIIGGIAILGDLSESMFKRDAGVKDSSSMLPEHGGMLDKLDGILFASPVIYILVSYII